MRATVVNIMESFPVILRLRLPDGAVKDFDTTEDCVVRAGERRVSMNEVSDAQIDFTLRDDRICEIKLVQAPDRA